VTYSVVELVCGKLAPDESIRTTGRFPRGWVEQYLEALSKEANSGPANASIHKGLVHAVHWASFHLWFRYASWLSEGGSIPETEVAFEKVHVESEFFFWEPLSVLPPIVAKNTHTGHEQEIIRLCFYDNVLLPSSRPAEPEVIKWSEEYRLHLAAIRESWNSTEYWSRWVVHAIRFASIYLGVAILTAEGETLANKQSGHSADRVSALVGRLLHILPAKTIDVASRWLRLAHLPRSSEGMPAEVSKHSLTQRARVRTLSEIVLQSGRNSCP
jgi:hypothetical protein